MEFVSKNKVMELTGIKENELEYIVSNYPGTTYYKKENKILYNPNLVVKNLRKEKTKTDLSFVNVNELFEIAYKEGIFSEKNKNLLNNMSKKVAEAAKDVDISVVTTLKHSTVDGRKPLYRLYRERPALKFLRETYSKQMTLKEQIKTSVKVIDTNKSVADSIIRIQEILANTYIRLDKMERYFEEKFSLIEKQVLELNTTLYKIDSTKQTSTSIQSIETNNVENKTESRIYLNKDQVGYAKYVLENQHRLPSKPKGGQVKLMESLGSQFVKNPDIIWVYTTGLRILNEYYTELSGIAV